MISLSSAFLFCFLSQSFCTSVRYSPFFSLLPLFSSSCLLPSLSFFKMRLKKLCLPNQIPNRRYSCSLCFLLCCLCVCLYQCPFSLPLLVSVFASAFSGGGRSSFGLQIKSQRRRYSCSLCFFVVSHIRLLTLFLSSLPVSVSVSFFKMRSRLLSRISQIRKATFI